MRLLNNLLSLTGAEVVSKLVTFAAFAYVARLTGPAGLGYVEFAGAVTFCAALFVDQGFGLFGAREIAKRPESTARHVAEIVFARFLLALIAYSSIFLLVLFLDRPTMQNQLVLLYGLSLFGMPLLLQWVFQGHDRMHLVAVMQILRQGVFSLVVFAFFRERAELWIVALGELAGVCAAALYGAWMYQRLFGEHVPMQMALSKRLLREGMTIGLSQMFWSTRWFGATVLVGIIATEEDLGFFGAAMRILIAMHAFVWLYYFNLLPSMSRRWNEGLESFQQLIDRSTHAMAWLCSAGGILWMLLSPLAIRIAYGSLFAPAAPALQWLGAVVVMAAINGHFRFALVAAGRQAAELITAALGAAFTLTLIPIGYSMVGVDGAAMALVVGELVVWMSSWILSRRLLGLGGHLRHLGRPIIATIATGGMLWLLGPVPVLVGTSLTVVGLAAAAFATDREIRERLRRIAVLSYRRAWKA